MSTDSSEYSSSSDYELKPLFAWCGGKGRSLDFLYDNLPDKFNNYFDPFVGGGSVFLSLEQPNTTICDTNSHLIEFYKSIRDNPIKYINRVNKLIKEFNKSNDKRKYYEQIRVKFNKLIKKCPTFESSILFLFLIKTGFQGQWRINSNGYLNMGVGLLKDKPYINIDDALDISNYLQKCKIYNKDYASIEKKVKKGDLVYIDPPYIEDKKQDTNFNSYDSGGWGMNEHNKLFDFIHRLDKKGAYVMMSNNDNPIIKKKFSGDNFKIKYIKVGRTVGPASKSKMTKEILLKNF